MADVRRPALLARRKKSLPACIAALLAVGSMAVQASDDDAIGAFAHGDLAKAPYGGIHEVVNCSDSGPGSLRDAVDNATSGDAIDLTELACSVITLDQSLQVTVSDLTLLGPGAGPDASHHVAIYGTYGYRILEHGAGTLVISGLKLAYGHYLGPLSRGGCIFSTGSLVIEDSIVTGCEVDQPFGANGIAAGGAIYTQGQLWLKNSAITNNFAYATTGFAYGAGIFASNTVTIDESTIADNKAIAPQAYAIGGGLMITGFGDVAISSSTISGNTAELAGGLRTDTLGTTKIVNSTLSGNYASQFVGGASFSSGPVTLFNSTVTRNTAYGYGIAGIYSQQAITLQGSIVADNRDTAGNPMLDVCAPSIGGAANVIMGSCTSTPGGTITTCPRLSALKDHGGPTLTHALIAGSPGIDHGNNMVPVVADERGLEYPRVFGASADAGAYEWQGELGDIIFKSAFEIACDDY